MAKGSEQLKNFEANFSKLETLVNELEATDLTLKESLDIYEKAMKVSNACVQALDYAQQRATELANTRPVLTERVRESDDESV
ncbi:exodeoxyribonuclease VII small subunit [Megasphaera lornae]|jgi:hypothetical protein|uniref:Exodeoxyribonuclease 7 small subunit n=1 Tax=Megasphaera lornae TaxID=1000568 RepID=D3LU99_9FIRM|nr:MULTISPECIES: exodeoxyribonuclease VII small subunit [Megasphaera]EFD94255.1 exodeoxyribonuclease VII, small subunit [Megasphaera genomosp. type_1 str. 28L]EGL40947.1 exodeoxyribonuclease VII, small subunit [Megasphaera lornae]KXB90971.1 exodeoxyribonuclease VII, small subunit [Veillonellaceae bacterium DNF00751]MUP50654.1 exodeoxyribonuclease VII small subunit [Veillonellaceae bacterium M1-70]